MRIFVSYFVLILCLFLSSCKGQSTATKPVSVTSIHQDSISARAETLAEFKVNVHDQDYQGNQLSGVVRTMFQDSKGDLWFGTQNGLGRYNADGLVYYDLMDWNGQSATIHVILEDATGTIWIGFSGGIAAYDGTKFTMYYEKDILSNGGVWSMLMDQDGLLWIGTTKGVYTFDGEALTPFDLPEGKKNPAMGVSTAKMVHSIIEDRKGHLWFATNGGAYRYDGHTLTGLSEQDGLQSDFVHQIVEAADGNYWIATFKGLSQYDGTSVINITENLLKGGEGIGCIFEASNGTLWFTANKRDVYSYKDEVFTKVHIKDGDFIPLPFQIYEDQQERLWFVGFKGAYRLEYDSFVNVTRDGPW